LSGKFSEVRSVPILPPFCNNISPCGLGLRGTFYAIIVNVGFAFDRHSAAEVDMNASELAGFLRLDDFMLSLLTVQAPYEWGWRMHPMWGSGWGIGMMIMMALFWGAIIVAVILGMRWFVGQNKNSPGDSAMTILRERFARGEIEKDEFETKKRELS